MPPLDLPELVAGGGLALLLIAIAVFFAWRQWRTLQNLRQNAQMSGDERRFVWHQVLRRLAGSLLMVLFAGLLVGWYFIEPTIPRAPVGEVPPEVEAAARDSVRLVTLYWIFALFVLLAILGLAVLDLFATGRFGLRQQKILEADRRAMLQDEAARLRRRRQEMN